jgi:hypothetical protein
MIPSADRRLFRAIVQEALSLGREGRVREGYRVLDLGLALAEAAEALGHTWAEALISRYRVALVRYAETFPEAINPAALERRSQ